MKLVVTRFRRQHSDWFVSTKDERMSTLLKQPIPDTDSPYLTTWTDRRDADAYANAVLRLTEQFPDKAPEQIRERARDIARHG